MGTDEFGRDILSRIIHSSQIELLVCLSGVGLAAALGVTLGLLSGYRGGWFDAVIMRLQEAFLAFPAILFAILVAVALGSSALTIILTVGVIYMPRSSPIGARARAGPQGTGFCHGQPCQRCQRTAHSTPPYFAQLPAADSGANHIGDGHCHPDPNRVELSRPWHPTADCHLGQYAATCTKLSGPSPLVCDHAWTVCLSGSFVTQYPRRYFA